jgi:hypothetical protein
MTEVEQASVSLAQVAWLRDAFFKRSCLCERFSVKLGDAGHKRI